MSYGLEILNPSGKLVFSDQAIGPWFAGKLSAGVTPTAYYTYGGYRVYKIAYTFPALVAGRTYIYATALPDGSNTDQWYSAYMSAPSYVGTAVGRFVAAPIATPTASLVLPEVYAFCTSNQVASADTYGLRVYAANGVDLVFDSGNKPLMLLSMPSVSLLNASVAVSTMPTKPAFFLYEWARERGVSNGNGTINIVHMGGFFKRIGSNVIGNTFEYKDTFEDIASIPTSTFGSTAAQPIPVINATNYD